MPVVGLGGPPVHRRRTRDCFVLINIEEALNQPELYITAKTLQQTYGTA
jgi:hypothetical protein